MKEFDFKVRTEIYSTYLMYFKWFLIGVPNNIFLNKTSHLKGRWIN